MLFSVIDRAFLTSGLSDKRHTEIIRFIITLASALDMAVIAEGVDITMESLYLPTNFSAFLRNISVHLLMKIVL